MKKGLDYFPFDKDFFDDVRIMRIMSFHTYGGYVYQRLLCMIYDKTYYIKCNEDLIFLIANKFRISEDEVSQIINRCIEVGLFDRDTYETHGVLTSKGIQERYSDICQRAKRNTKVSEFSLISSEEIGGNAPINDISSEEIGGNAPINDISSEEIGGNAPINDISSESLLNIKDKSKNIILSNDSVQNSEQKDISPPKRAKPDYQYIVNLWHEVCTSYPTITKLTDKRKKKIDLRMAEIDMDYGVLRTIFEKMQHSSFMRGGSWASFDWVFSSEGNMTKVLEGNYDDRPTGQRTFQEINKNVNDLWN